MKRYRTWLWLAVVFLFLNACIHTIAMFAHPTPANETERQLIYLMTNYKIDLGAGFKRSYYQLFTALSSCYSFICLLSGLTLTFLLKRRAPVDILKGVAGIHALVFVALAVVIAMLTFLAPIILSGLTALFLTIGWLTTPAREPAAES